MSRSRPARFSLLLAIAALLAVSVGAPASAAPPGKGGNTAGKAVFFAADGMRQDIVEKYAAAGVMPTMKEFLKGGTKASGNGLLTQAPPNTGSGWYTLATGAWPGVHGSTNNTFHKNGDAFGTARTTAFDPGVLQAEIDRPIRRAGRPQGRAGRVGRRSKRHHPGPDDRFPGLPLRPRRGDQLHRRDRRRPVRRRAVHQRLRSPVRPSLGLPGRRPGSSRRRGDRRRVGVDQRAVLGGREPGEGDAAPRARWAEPEHRSGQVRPQRLHLRQHRRRHCQLRPRPVLEDEERDGARCSGHAGRGRVGRRQGDDQRRRPQRPDGRHARQGRGARPPISPASACSTRASPARTRPGRRGAANRASAAPSRSTWPRRSRPRPPQTSPSSRPA